MLALRRHAQQGAHRLALDQDDPLVALADLRQVALRHRPAAPEAGGLLQQRVEVPVVVADVEDALAALAVEGLHDHLAAELVEEVEEVGQAARDARRDHQLGEAQGVELLVGAEDGLRAVQHQRAAAEAQHLEREHVGGVDGRVLALPDHVDLGVEDRLALGAQLGVAPPLAAQARRAHVRAGRPVRDEEVARVADPDRVPAALRLEHEREGGVLVDVDGLDGVHQEGHHERALGHPLPPGNR